MLTLRLEVPDDHADTFRRTVADDLFPRALALNGVVACHLYAADPSASFVKTAESRNRTLDVPAWVILVEATRVDGAQRAQDMIDGDALRRLDVKVRSDAAIYALEICRLGKAEMRGNAGSESAFQ